MSLKDYLEFIFFMCCTFFTLIVYDLFWGINTGLSPYDNCIVGNINEFKGGRLIDYLSVYGLYFILGILPFAWSFILYMLLKTKIPTIGKFFSADSKKRIPDFYNSSLFYFIAALIYVPLPLVIYDFLLC